MAAMAPEHAPHPLNLDSITALVHGFYADVRADPLLGPVFTQAIGAASYASDMENSKMTMFIGRSYADATRDAVVDILTDPLRA